MEQVPPLLHGAQRAGNRCPTLTSAAFGIGAITGCSSNLFVFSRIYHFPCHESVHKRSRSRCAMMVLHCYSADDEVSTGGISGGHFDPFVAMAVVLGWHFLRWSVRCWSLLFAALFRLLLHPALWSGINDG